MSATDQPTPHTTDTTNLEDTIGILRRSFEPRGEYPLDLVAYNESIYLSHNWEPGAQIERDTFVKGLAQENAALKERFGSSLINKATRFLVAHETVVTTVITSGELSNGTRAKMESAAFFEFKNGRIAKIQAWYCQLEAKQFLDAIKAAGVWDGLMDL